MQEWTNGGTPVPAIGEAQVLLGTPLVGWGGTIEVPPAPPVVTEPQRRPPKPQHSPRKMETPRARMMTSCSFRWKSTRPRKVARLASSIPSDPDPGNEAVLVQDVPLVLVALSRVVCPRSVSRVVGMYPPRWFVIKTCLCSLVCYVLDCVLAGRSRPCLFKKKSDIIHLNIT
jgi:hypothetical protein